MKTAIWILSALVLASNAATVTNSVAVSCHKEDSMKCIIQSINLRDAQELQLPRLDGKATLQIKGGSIPSFEQRICDQLPNSIVKLQLGSLAIQELFLKPSLVEVEAERNEISSVIFDSNKEYRLAILKLAGNKLTDLTGFERLTNLTELQLSSNRLETVNMQTFAGMVKLERLYLDHNEITTITTTEAVSLPALDFLSLADNKISRLDVLNWKFDSLTSLDVSGNDLVHIDGLSEHLVTLQSITLARNAWHCMWLQETLKHFNDSYVQITDSDRGCEGITSVNICCQVEPELGGTYDENFQMLERLEKDQKKLQQTLDEKVRFLVSEQQNKLATMEKRIADLISKQSTMVTVSDQDNEFQHDFKSLKDGLHEVKLALEEQIKQTKRQNDNNRRTERQLRYSIVELKRSLEREIKKIAELQAQFGLVKEHVVKAHKRGSI